MSPRRIAAAHRLERQARVRERFDHGGAAHRGVGERPARIGFDDFEIDQLTNEVDIDPSPLRCLRALVRNSLALPAVVLSHVRRVLPGWAVLRRVANPPVCRLEIDQWSGCVARCPLSEFTGRLGRRRPAWRQSSVRR
jgi:hypothetical protein